MTDVLRRSVTRDNEQPATSGVFFFNAGPAWGASDFPIPPTPPPYGTPSRDQILRATVHAEGMWAAAIGKAISKMIALPWDIKDSGGSTQRIKRCQELLLYADGRRGWAKFLSKHLRDFLTTDNGAVIEIERYADDPRARIKSINHLDSCRVRRTGNYEEPAVYIDLMGREHLMKWYQVAFITDMVDSAASMFDMGFCAASRAYTTIYKLAGIDQYFTEKITGGGQNAIHIIRGITDRQLTDALITHAAERTRAGFVTYKGQVLIPQMGNQEINIASIDLAGIPDGFDAEQERNNGYIKYANDIGIPVQDIAPLNGRSLGTGKQTEVLDEAADKQGLAAWQTQFIHFVNTFFPETTTMVFVLNDIRNEKAMAEVRKLRAEARSAMIADGTITKAQALQMAVDDGDAPREFLPSDQTEGQQLGDDEKPVEASADDQVETAPEAEGETTKQSAEDRAMFANMGSSGGGGGGGGSSGGSEKPTGGQGGLWKKGPDGKRVPEAGLEPPRSGKKKPDSPTTPPPEPPKEKPVLNSRQRIAQEMIAEDGIDTVRSFVENGKKGFDKYNQQTDILTGKPIRRGEPYYKIGRNLITSEPMFDALREAVSSTTKAAKYPAALDRLIAKLSAAIEEQTDALALDQTTPSTWQDEIAKLLQRYSASAWKAGQKGDALTKDDIKAVKSLVSAQLAFLDNFTLEIQTAAEWQAGWNARAQMYAESIKVPYWKGATKVLPLPAMPAEGTDCLSRCRCAWSVDTLDAEAGDYDCYWRRGASDSCATCRERAAQWSPLQIRGGMLL